MTEAAAFAGTYSDLKLVKSRSVAQIVIELPIERAEAFLKVFGVPQPGAEKPVALALLNPSSTDKPPPLVRAAAGGKRRWDEMSRAQQAGILCADEQFQQFLGQPNESATVQTIYEMLSIASRTKLDVDESAGRAWDALVTDYWIETGQMAAPR